MPFERAVAVRKRIAVIGGGISGMGAAHMLADHHDVVLIEAEPRLGGHARTLLAGRNGDQPVDTGFIVFNKVNYPRLVDLFGRLDVPTAPSAMTFGASIDQGKIEYGLRDLRSVFAQKRNLLRPHFLRMISDILRFNREAEAATGDLEISIGELLTRLGTGEWFREYYLSPISGAIWSTPTERIMDFPARTFVEFFRNHALLHHTGQHQWYTVRGGSVEYVRRLETTLRAQGVDIRLSAPVDRVHRADPGAVVHWPQGACERFDAVIFATHSDDTLRLLADPTSPERAALSDVSYQSNAVTLHADASVMPRRRACWSSWNYAGAALGPQPRIDLTYWMNALQPIPPSDPLFVTLNSTRAIREHMVYDRSMMRHPVYDLAAFRAQDQLRRLNGTRDTWFCGAWMRNGFHEDGLASAADVAGAILGEHSGQSDAFSR